MNFKKIAARAVLIVPFAAMVIGCTVKYSFSGASIPVDAKTFSVAYFPNNSQYVSPTLSQVMTDQLTERMERQTRLSRVREGGDLSFQGEVTGWTVAPSMISSNDGTGSAAATNNRLTITVRVQFTNAIQEQYNYSRTFSAYSDFAATTSIMSVEGELIESIVEDLVNQIFNAAVTNW